MTKKDILELKRRFTKDGCTFTRMCGCYVDASHEPVVKFSETFLNLEDEELYKYLDIAKKTLSGTVGNNLLQLDFPTEEEFGGRQQFLMGLKTDALRNESIVDRLYEQIIENYSYVGNYLILLFHDAYDVMTKTSDNRKLDESEEVYEYILCSICPVCLSKPGLGYNKEENRIAPRIQDWVVGAPDTGFVFPAFSDRSSDIHSLIFYVKDAKDAHPEIAENVLGCTSKLTATQQKNTFHAIIRHALGPDEEKTEELLLEVQENLEHKIMEQEEISDIPAEEITLTKEEVSQVLMESGIPVQTIHRIEDTYAEEFRDMPPVAKNLIDEKALENNQKIKKEKELMEKVEDLQNQLVEQNDCDVILRVKPEKAELVKSRFIDNRKYLMIPMEENESINLNGVQTTL